MDSNCEEKERQAKNHLAEDDGEGAGRNGSLVGQAQAKTRDRVQMWGMTAT